jgi:hypothetical protein
VGIPAFYCDAGIDFPGKPPDWGRGERERYVAEDYHKPSDEMKEWWDLSGAVQDLELLFAMGRELAEGELWPEWSSGSEFRSIREASRE